MIRSAGPLLRPITQADVREAISIIEDLDEDDAESAAAMYAEDLLGHFVLVADNRLIGVTGAVPIEETEAAYILGPTHILRHETAGSLSMLIQELIQRLSESGGRKIFAHLSDYIDPEDGDVYAKLRRALADQSFHEELRHDNFYDIGETEIVYGRRLTEGSVRSVTPDHRNIRLTDMDLISETDGCYWIGWELDETADPLSRGDFQKVFDLVSQWGARSLFMALPAGISSVDETMRRAKFRFAGRILDFYEDGVDQVRFRYDL